MIEAHHLTKRFENFLAVEDITINVMPGSVVAILGPNGAGKTTTVRMLTSILIPSSGWARVAGYDVVKEASAVRASVGVLTEQHGLYDRMKGLEYLDFFGRMYNVPANVRKNRALALMERFGLGKALDKRIIQYSKGMKQKLALVRAMLHDPPVLLLDEPTSAMDPQSAKQVRDAIMELRRDKRTVMLTTHNLNEAHALADKIAVIRQGRIIADGTFEDLAEKFVGPPLMRLEVVGDISPYLAALPSEVTVQESGPNWVDFTSPDPPHTNPKVVRAMVEAGAEVVALQQRSRTLEDVYLKIVEEDESRVGTNR